MPGGSSERLAINKPSKPSKTEKRNRGRKGDERKKGRVGGREGGPKKELSRAHFLFTSVSAEHSATHGVGEWG